MVEQVTIPDGKTLKLGMEDERVPLLRQRLGVAAPEIPEGATDATVDITDDVVADMITTGKGTPKPSPTLR